MPKAVGKYKICSKCRKKKLLFEFAKNKRNVDGLEYRCKECKSKSGKIFRKENLEFCLKRERRKNIKLRYGLTIEQWEEMFKQQQGCCAICGEHQSELKKTLVVDHRHSNGKIRELLCGNCNRMLGCVKENIGTLKKAMDYLEKHNEQ